MTQVHPVVRLWPPADTVWRPWKWALLVLGSLTGFVVIASATLGLWLDGSTMCSEPGTIHHVQAGEAALLVLVTVASVPWAVATWYSRSRSRVVVGWLTCLSPALFLMLIGLNPDTWTGSTCL